MVEKSNFQANMARHESIKEQKEKGFLDVMYAGEEAMIATVDTRSPINFDRPTWDRIQSRDTKVGNGKYMSPAESRNLVSSGQPNDRS